MPTELPLAYIAAAILGTWLAVKALKKLPMLLGSLTGAALAIAGLVGADLLQTPAGEVELDGLIPAPPDQLPLQGLWPEVLVVPINEYTVTVFAAHLVAGAGIMAATYLMMENWYKGGIITAPALAVTVASFDRWLLRNGYTPWMHGVTMEEAAFAAGTAFVIGLTTAVLVIEPEFQNRRTTYDNEDNLPKLKL
jgi:hypothetical protein